MPQPDKPFHNIQPDHITPEVISLLDAFVESVPPRKLRKNVLELYFNYIIREHEMLPWDIGELSVNIYLLLDFLDATEEKISTNQA